MVRMRRQWLLFTDQRANCQWNRSKGFGLRTRNSRKIVTVDDVSDIVWRRTMLLVQTCRCAGSAEHVPRARRLSWSASWSKQAWKGIQAYIFFRSQGQKMTRSGSVCKCECVCVLVQKYSINIQWDLGSCVTQNPVLYELHLIITVNFKCTFIQTFGRKRQKNFDRPISNKTNFFPNHSSCNYAYYDKW